MDLVRTPDPWLFSSILVALAASTCINVLLLVARTRSKKQLQAASLGSTTRTNLPDGWWSDPGRFQDERRAIFSQTWLCLSHRGRFQAAGDYVVYQVAGFRLFMILGKDGVVRSFHNVCRHRAFPVARKQSGSATVLGCRYHGWSYDTKGALIKAPYFDQVPGFERSQNSLYEIRTMEDGNGFLHINVSVLKDAASTRPPGPIKIGRVGRFSPKCNLLDTIELKAKFNWKVLLNNQTRASLTGVSAKGVVRAFSSWGPTPVGEMVFPPLTTVHTMAGRPFWYQLTYSPDAVQETSLRCDVYSTAATSDFKFEGAVKEGLEQELKDKLRGLEEENRSLAGNAHTDIGTSGAQATVAAAVDKHLRAERIRGSEIKPAAVTGQFGGDFVSKAEKICEATECGNGGDARLAW